MQLRTSRKQSEIDFEENQTQNNKKNQKLKNQNEKEKISSEENSKLSTENNKIALRYSSINYQGKYKKMNSGKDLYKLSSKEKKPQIIKKKHQLRFLTDLIPQFKSFLNHLYVKDEENILNKKKKREETKQKIKAEKNNRNINKQIQNYTNMFITQMNPYQQIQNYNISNNNYQFFNNYNNNYKYKQNEMMLFNNNFLFSYVTLPINTNNNSIYSIIQKTNNKGTVNHIVGALYILKTQQNKNNNIDKKVIRINTVINENQIYENNNNNLNNNNNYEKNNFEILNNNSNNISNQEKQNPKSNEEIEQKNEEKVNQNNIKKGNEILPNQEEIKNNINNLEQEKK